VIWTITQDTPPQPSSTTFEYNSLKATLTLIDTDLRACRTMVNNLALWNAEAFRCHAQHIIKNSGELLALLDPQRAFGEEVHVQGTT
jgi:hypothetical protein